MGVLFFSYDVPHIGETDTMILYNKLNQLKNKKPEPTTPHYSAEITEEGTGTITENAYEKVCNNNIEFCNTIKTDTTGSDIKFQNYKIASIVTIVKINNIIATPYSLAQALENITLKREDNDNR
jgi:hypothetical protein